MLFLFVFKKLMWYYKIITQVEVNFVLSMLFYINHVKVMVFLIFFLKRTFKDKIYIIMNLININC